VPALTLLGFARFATLLLRFEFSQRQEARL